MKDLAAAAQKAKLNGGSSGNATPPYLTLALFERQTKASFTHVPYKGGPPSGLHAGSADCPPFADHFSSEVTRWAKLMEEKHIRVE